MAKPYSFEDSIYRHDKAILNWLDTFHVDYGTISGVDRNNSPVIRVMASPHRAFAATVSQLVAQKWVSANDPAIAAAMATYNWPVLPLPVITIERDDPIISNELANVPATFRNGEFNEITGTWTKIPYPLHYITQYRITIWSEKRYTNAHFMEWLLSQIGQVGAWQREVFIPVDHGDPWGTINQALRYQGSSDLSDLEGNEARHIRSQLSFTFRSWFFRAVPEGTGGPPIYAVRPMSYAADSFSSGTPSAGNFAITYSGYRGFDDPNYVMPPDSEFETVPSDSTWLTDNLFGVRDVTSDDVATLWPSLGNSSVSISPYSPSSDVLRGLRVSVEQSTDVVTLTNRLTTPDADGYSIWSFMTSYRGGPWTLLGSQFRNVTSGSPPVTTVVGPEDVFTTSFADTAGAWLNSHVFTVCRGDQFAWRAAGSGASSIVDVVNVDVRQVNTANRLHYTNWSGDLVSRYYDWTNLEAKPYLIVAMFQQTAPASGNITVFDDVSAPSASMSRPASIPGNLGVALLIQPRESSVRLVIPAAFPVVAVYALSFDGFTVGNSI